MLLINKILLKMSKGIRHWVFIIATCKLLVLIGTASFAQSLSGFLGSLYEPQMTRLDLWGAVISALFSALLVLAGELLVGEAEFRCTEKARIVLRKRIFSKILLLDVGKVEKIGATSAIASAADGVESMQQYYCKYLPGLIYCGVAPIYLFFRLRSVSLPVAVLLLAVSFLILPANNIFRQVLEKLKTDYWSSFRDLTGYYLESLRSLTTLKLFRRDIDRTAKLKDKALDFNMKIMSVMKINFMSFLLTESLLHGSVFVSVVIVCVQLVRGSIGFSSAMMVLILSYSFFSSIRSLMNATHQALSGIAAAQNISDLLDIDVSRPTKLLAAGEKENDYEGIRIENVSFSYTGRERILKDISLDIPKGRTVALIGRSGCGKSTIASLLLRFSDPESGLMTFEGTDYLGIAPDELRKKNNYGPPVCVYF